MSIAVYRDFEPWSWRKDGRLVGIDVELAQLIGHDLGLAVDPIDFLADESVDDDLRNMVWKGSKVGGSIADLMMHAPIDPVFAARNDQAAFVAPYYHESFALACDKRAANCDADLSTFRDRKVAVELDSVPDTYLLGSFGGRLRATILHEMSGSAAVAALAGGQVPVAMATRAQIEHGIVGSQVPLVVRRTAIPGLFSTGWDVGIAVKADSRDLGERVAAAVAAAVADRRIEAVFDRYGVHRDPPKTA